MLHNEDLFPEPMSFRPERWMGTDITKENDTFSIGFGFGRRYVTTSYMYVSFPFIPTSCFSECPGKALAQELVFTAVTNILAVFDVSRAHKASGKDVEIEAKFSSGAIR